MTPKISLITAVAVTAVAVGAPAAFGEGRYPDSQAPSARVDRVAPTTAITSTPEVFEHGLGRAVEVPNGLWMAKNGLSRPVTERSARDPNIRRFSREQAEGVRLARSDRSDARRAWLESMAHPAGTAALATVSSGGGIEWPQIGVGFVVGILLALGLMLSMRHTRVRALAE
jgi:hypothetical protein